MRMLNLSHWKIPGQKNAKGQRGYHEPRTSRGLSDRVFLDPSRKRKSRVLLSASTVAIGVVVWLALFATTVGSNGGLEAALPEPIGALKGRGSTSDQSLLPKHQGGQSHNGASVDLHAQQEAQKYQCSEIDEEGGAHLAASQTQRVFAVVPADLPWAAKSLNESCGTIHVVLPTWFHVTNSEVGPEVRSVSAETRGPLWEYVSRNQNVMVMPILQIDASTLRFLANEGELRKFAAALAKFFGQQAGEGNGEKPVEGFCLDANFGASMSEKVFSTFSQQVTKNLRERRLESCVKLPSSASDSLLVIANRFFDTVIVNGYQEYWLGSAPQPLADKLWFDAHVSSLQNHVAPGKLVVELGTHAVDWISGLPRPEIQPFAKIMTALAEQGRHPEFAAVAGNTRASYVDGQGRQHRAWILEAASAHNQILSLQNRGVNAFGLSGLGYEDPGIWAVIDQTMQSRVLKRESLQNVVLSNYVELLGNGPFVAPISMPQVGKRLVELNHTGRISAVSYETLPKASVVQLYGAGEIGQVVLTFDDGPHPKHTPLALDILKETQTPASFFVLGKSAAAEPDLVMRILSEGHEVGSHTYSHPNMGQISASRAKVEINSTQLLLNGITGRNMRLYREPYMRSGGPVTSREVASLMPLEKAGYVIAGMDVVPRDWITQTPDELAEEIIRQVEVQGGGVVLLHDGGGDQSQTVAALPRVISELREKGYTFTTLGDLLGAPPELLMPAGNRVTSAFGSMSFSAIENSWSLLKIIFWSVFAIGAFRSASLLLLAMKRKRHATPSSIDAPSVTIVIPAYNEGKVIEKCIRQALYSEYPDFDIIVVDDGSTDDTYEKAISFAYHPLVTVLRQPNRGKAAALNAALDEAQSDVLICIDADSQIAPDAVGLLACHFNDLQVGAVAGRVVVGNRGNILTRLQALEYVTAQAVERRAKEYLNAITVVPGAIGAWRATALMEAGIFSTETLTEDADMTMAMLRSDYQVIYEDRAVALTEAPMPLKALMTQRLRWSLGMMQAGWKHLGAIGERRSLGLVALPDLAIFGYLMPFIAPLADLFLILLLTEFFMTYGAAEQDYASLLTNPLLIAFLALPVLEVFSATMAFRFDSGEDRRLLLLLPLQRVYFRHILYICVIQAVWRAATGSLASWGRMTRVGYKFEQAKLT